MKRILFTILLLCWPLAAHAWTGKVISVTDGDTIKVLRSDQGQIKIRLYGIDTPEKGQAYGKAAKKHLASLIAGANVEVESVTTDRYGRTVGIVWKEKSNINEQMVRAGYAWVYRYYCKKLFCPDWIDIESGARNSKIGLWQEPNPIPPWEWRRENN